MSTAKEALETLERLAAKSAPIVNHPFTFAVGVGLANGALARIRDKRVDLPTAVALATILGLGEMALEYFTPPEKLHHSLPMIGVFSVLGVAVGLAPFVELSPSEAEYLRGIPVAAGIKIPVGSKRSTA